jgi:hypothetical protein
VIQVFNRFRQAVVAVAVLKLTHVVAYAEDGELSLSTTLT